MSDWKPRMVAVQAIIELPDGTTKEASVQLVPEMLIPGSHGGVFRGARCFIAHERPATYDMKLKTTEGVENVKRGSRISYAGEPVDLDLTDPEVPPYVHDRLLVIPPPIARNGQP